MKNSISFAVLALMGICPASAWSEERAVVQSIHDLPRVWTGVAGDFAGELPAELRIEKVTHATREERVDGYLVRYEVDASFQIGTRAVRVLRLEFSHLNEYRDTYWLKLDLESELNPRLSASIVYDESGDRYTLKELPKAGERRFVLRGVPR